MQKKNLIWLIVAIVIVVVIAIPVIMAKNSDMQGTYTATLDYSKLNMPLGSDDKTIVKTMGNIIIAYDAELQETVSVPKGQGELSVGYSEDNISDLSREFSCKTKTETLYAYIPSCRIYAKLSEPVKFDVKDAFAVEAETVVRDIPIECSGQSYSMTIGKSADDGNGNINILIVMQPDAEYTYGISNIVLSNGTNVTADLSNVLLWRDFDERYGDGWHKQICETEIAALKDVLDIDIDELDSGCAYFYFENVHANDMINSWAEVSVEITAITGKFDSCTAMFDPHDYEAEESGN